MPKYMDRHDDVDGSAVDVAALHLRDLDVQAKHGVQYLSYWFDPDAKKVFCFVDAPSKEAAEAVHAEAHGDLAAKIIEVEGETVSGFLGPLPPATPGVPAVDSAFRSILFTDIVDSTSLTQKLGDLKAMDVVRAHDRVVRSALAALEGSEVKHTGDGIMASFASAEQSIECAIAIQRQLDEHDRSADVPFQVRIGVSAGEPVAEGNDLFGTAVQLAARACARADAGGILVSTAVQELCNAKEYAFAPRGPFELKGFDDPVPLFEVSWGQDDSA